MEVVAIVLGAGSGQRMGGRPKALLDLLGRPMFFYSVQSFVLSGQIAHTVLVVPPGAIEEVQIQLAKYELTDFVTVIGGGNSRSQRGNRIDCPSLWHTLPTTKRRLSQNYIGA